MDKEFKPASAAAGAEPTSLEQVKQSVHSDLEYVSIEVHGASYGGWYRVLSDGQMELLALANMHCELRTESTPLEQARHMLTDFIHVARSKQKTNESAAVNPDTGLNGATGSPRHD